MNGFINFKTIAHELKHNSRLLHTNLWRTTDRTVTDYGVNVQYGDSFDLMGAPFNRIFDNTLHL